MIHPPVRAAQLVLDCLQTGDCHGTYAAVTVVPGRMGDLRYGRAGASLRDASLRRLIDAYGQQADAGPVAARFRPFAAMLKDRNAALAGDTHFHNLLRAAADDPAMRACQDAAVDAAWTRAQDTAARHGFESALALGVIQDGLTVGGWESLRRGVTKSVGPVRESGEPAWLTAYLQDRRTWLARHRSAAVRETLPHTVAFEGFIRLGNWGLRPPFVIRGLEVPSGGLTGQPPGTFDGPAPGSRVLALKSPFLRGADVRQLQLGLSGLSVGAHVAADGIYGPVTDDAVRALQDMLGYTPTGRAGADVFEMLAR